jgi:hypothetical protein
MAVKRLAIVIVLALVGSAGAQPADTQPADTARILHDANDAAVAGNWSRVDELVRPLFVQAPVAPADLAEAHRLAGLAAILAEPPRRDEADANFLAWLKYDPDAVLDAALVRPEAREFLTDVRARHKSELRKSRPQKRHWILNLVPIAGQVQNGERVKGYVLGGALGALVITNVTTYLVLSSWCTRVTGAAGSSATCNVTTDHDHASSSLRAVNIISGVGAITVYAYGVYDSVVAYRRRSHEQLLAPYATTTSGGSIFGLAGSF